ncbi:MAG: aminotransferase class V-fold PLP-dependent enzyme, partial [Brevundimonas sp.]
WLHVDAIQSAGKIPVDMRVLDADSLTLSAHKLGGPQGVGALILKEGVSGVRILHGAGQERGLRAGTENVPGIAGFGVAADCAARDLKTMASHVGWRDSAEARVKAAGATVIGADVARLPNTLFMAVEGWDSPQQLIILDLAGVMVSAGSACSSGKVKPSKTISAMGLNALATGGVRVSGGWGTTESDWVRFADAWIAAYDKHKTRAAARVREVA